MNEASELRSELLEVKAQNTRLRGEENYLKAKLEATELRLLDANLQLRELASAWTELKAAEEANAPSGEFREDALRRERVRAAKGKLNLALDGITEKPKSESRYGWSDDPQADRELQKKYGDSVHRPNTENRKCECGAVITPEGHACGYHKSLSGGTAQ